MCRIAGPRRELLESIKRRYRHSRKRFRNNWLVYTNGALVRVVVAIIAIARERSRFSPDSNDGGLARLWRGNRRYACRFLAFNLVEKSCETMNDNSLQNAPSFPNPRGSLRKRLTPFARNWPKKFRNCEIARPGAGATNRGRNAQKNYKQTLPN
jgi:hypothetical protein